MQFDNITVSYPAVHPGTPESIIHFYDGTPDPASLFTAGSADRRRLFVTDSTIAALPSVRPFISQFNNNKHDTDILLILSPGESSKNIDNVLRIIKAAISNGFNRNDLFTGIGGGVICDMTAFAASIFKRGIHTEFIPTTLLAMVDASVGGKTGCDFDGYKNMIGSFYPAETLYVFPGFIQTLPASEYQSGLAEAVKTSLLYSKTLYETLAGNTGKTLSRDPQTVSVMINSCMKAKAAVVEQDFTEQGIRMQLNFGHTFGHALETVAGLGQISHGNAVAWGMSRALMLSRQLGLCSPEYQESVTKTLSEFGWETGPVHSLLKNRKDSEKQLLAAMKKDKKNTGSKIKVILQKDFEQTVIREADDSEILKVLI